MYVIQSCSLHKRLKGYNTKFNINQKQNRSLFIKVQTNAEKHAKLNIESHKYMAFIMKNAGGRTSTT